jgi:hypothetical protein
MNADRKKIIDKFLDYIECMVRRNASRLTKLVVQGLIAKDKALHKDAQYSDDDSFELDDQQNGL